MDGYMYPPLLAVTALFQDKCVEIPHAISTVSLFLDSSLDLFLHQACKFGSFPLLQRIWDTSEIFANSDENVPDIFALSLRKYLRTDRHYRQYQFMLSILEVVKLKNLEMVRWLFERFPECKVYQKGLEEAVKQGSLEIVQFFYENNNRLAHTHRNGPIDWDTTLYISAATRHYDVMWWVYEHIPVLEESVQWALQPAIMHGDFHVVEQFISSDIGWTFAHIAYSVGESGHVDVLEWVAQRGYLSNFVDVVYGAAGNGQLDVVHWAVENHKKFVDISQPPSANPISRQIGSCIYIALVSGHKDVAQYLYSLREDLFSPEKFMDSKKYSALRPYFNVSSFNQRLAMTNAVKSAHFDAVQWIYETFNDEEDDKLLFFLRLKSDAASIGHLKMVKWLHEIQTSIERKFQQPQTSTTGAVDEAAKGGHLEVVQWLVKHANEESTTEAIDGAATNGHLNVVNWLLENSSVGCTERAMDGAARNGHLGVVKWLHVHRTEGCTTNALDGAAQNGYLDVVKWLHANRREGSSTLAALAMDLAAESGHLRVMQWLHTHRSEGCSSRGLQSAAWRNHFEVFLFVHERFPSFTCLVPKKNPEIKNWMREHWETIPDGLRENVTGGSDTDY